MSTRERSIARKTKETDISLRLDLSPLGTSAVPEVSVRLGVPFFEHMLHAMAFHGGFSLEVAGSGDIEVDPHHLVEDTGLVLGEALLAILDDYGPVRRYGHAVIPMDDALAEVAIDVCRRPYFVYQADYPQEYAGNFHIPLVREFLLALANRAQINLHALVRHGENSHHMVEALFKALGKAIASGYAPFQGGVNSTKGLL